MADELKTPPYVSWKTLNSVFDTLAEGMPSRIDRSVFSNQSGGVQAQLMTAFKFLELIEEDGTPTALLRAVAVPGEQQRKNALTTILSSAYPELFEADLKSMTAGQLYELMGKCYSCTGETREKAIRFLLAALQYAEIPVSRLLSQARAATGGMPRKARRTGARSRSGGDDTDDDEDADEIEADQSRSAPGQTKTVQLKSGGSLTVSATFDPFVMTADDRTFLFDLIDKLNAYERAGSSKQTTGGSDA